MKVIVTKFCSHIKKPVFLTSTNRLQYALFLYNDSPTPPIDFQPILDPGFTRGGLGNRPCSHTILGRFSRLVVTFPGEPLQRFF